MKGMEDFDLLACPLAGRLLIDASAGTGKTYTICGLVIRLLLERELPIQQILVLTYTEAATEDLRARTRAMIRLALKAFTAGRSDDPFFARLVQHHPDRNLACRRLTEALRGFDEAAIYTIHGFCQRMLKENSLESGSLFDTELITDQQHIVREIVEDFWRRHVYGGSLMFIEYAINRLSPDSLLAMLDRHLAKPSLSIIPEASEAECSGLTDAEEAFAGSFREVCRSWPAARGEVERVLLEDKGLNRKKYNPRSVPDWLAAMDAMTDRERPSPELFDKFEKFTAVEIGQSLKKGHAAPEHRFFDLCDTLWQQRRFLADHFDRCLLALKAELFSYVRQELIDRKHRLHVFAFDDLLRQLHEGLKSPNGLILAQNIRIRYPAALIDEFQDTDPLQYDIFATIYGATASGAAGQELLFLIGDPKQAIYSFRGADIFAYMQATREVGQRFTLGRNWRSDPGLIKAVNAIFKRAHDPFVYKEIPFSPVTPADKKNRSGFSINGRNDASFKLWVVQREQEDDSGKPSKPIGKEEARERILKAVAGEILRLLRLGGEHQALIGKEPVKPGDIAVLVRTNREAGMVRKALAP